MARGSALVFTLATLALVARANVELAPPFCDHAVLQRDRAVPVWGFADAGEEVAVRFHGAEVHAVTGPDGRWSVMLGPLPASREGADLVVAGRTTAIAHDVVVGDVFLCSGQSNMGMTVARSQNAQEEIAAANFPLVRVLSVRNTVAEKPATTVVTTGWRIASPETAGGFTAVGYFFARDLQRELGIPIGVLHSSYGGTRIEAWLSEAAIGGDPAFAGIVPAWKADNGVPYAKRRADYDAALAEWQAGDDRARAAGGEAAARYRREHRRPSAPMGPQQAPSALFNGMINPIVPYAVRAILWYQGESNVWNAGDYRRLFPALITSWRAHFGREDLPFFWVQLANFADKHDWSWLREAQTQALALPNTGQAVAIDIGEPGDIHPRNKQEVARRLLLIANAKLYGGHEEYSGPMLAASTREDGAIRVRFTHADGGLTVRGGAVTSLEIAGEDRVFHAAAGRIEGGELVVSAADVPSPVAVRYAWSSAPAANLYNAAGLPASPFRTDTW
ncbi:MAG TPA: sialate O-acetylesterase [Opitutus sp.]|nr:sialate O-acetylesterase [Opitutus sp.]